MARTNTTDELTPPMVGTREVAEALDVHPCTVHSLVNRGLIPVVRVGRRMNRYDLANVLAALRGRASATRQQTEQTTI